MLFASICLALAATGVSAVPTQPKGTGSWAGPTSIDYSSWTFPRNETTLHSTGIVPLPTLPISSGMPVVSSNLTTTPSTNPSIALPTLPPGSSGTVGMISPSTSGTYGTSVSGSGSTISINTGGAIFQPTAQPTAYYNSPLPYYIPLIAN